MKNKQLRVLAVDDMEARHYFINKHHANDEVMNIYNIDQACNQVVNHDPWHFDLIYLDHDAGFAGTFYPVACAIVAMKKLQSQINDDPSDRRVEAMRFPEVRVITANSNARRKLLELFEQNGIKCCYLDVTNLEYIVEEDDDE